MNAACVNSCVKSATLVLSIWVRSPICVRSAIERDVSLFCAIWIGPRIKDLLILWAVSYHICAARCAIPVCRLEVGGRKRNRWRYGFVPEHVVAPGCVCQRALRIVVFWLHPAVSARHVAVAATFVRTAAVLMYIRKELLS